MDWDKDGHLDILSGCYLTDGEDAGHIQMLSGDGSLNFGVAGPVLNAAGLPLLNAKLGKATESGMAEKQEDIICTHQHVVDYDGDGDGDLDLLTGGMRGGVHISINTGSREEPEWSEFEQLIAGPTFGISAITGHAHATPSGWTRIWVCDWNRDGLPDILMGDSARIGQPREGLSLDEYRQRG